MRNLVRGMKGGIEIVGLAANSVHTGYRVYGMRRGGELLDFTFRAMELQEGFLLWI